MRNNLFSKTIIFSCRDSCKAAQISASWPACAHPRSSNGNSTLGPGRKNSCHKSSENMNHLQMEQTNKKSREGSFKGWEGKKRTTWTGWLLVVVIKAIRRIQMWLLCCPRDCVYASHVVTSKLTFELTAQISSNWIVRTNVLANVIAT